MSQISDLALKKALTQMDAQEKPRGSNWGHPVQDYLLSVGINFPASWCAAFVYWSFGEAATELNTFNPLIKTGGVLAHWNKAKLKRVTEPQTGDIFIMDFGHGLGHTGFVESVEDHFINTVEGNSNDTGSREGYEVCRKKRPTSKILGYLRY